MPDEDEDVRAQDLTDEKAWRAALAIFSDVDRALEKETLTTGYLAYLIWVVGMAVGVAITFMLGTLLGFAVAGLPILGIWIVIFLILMTVIIRHAEARTTLALGRLPPDKRKGYQSEQARTGMRIGLGWGLSFAVGIPFTILGGITGWPTIAFGVQLGVGIGNLIMGLGKGAGNKEPRGIGIMLLASLPVTVWLDSVVMFYGFAFFTVMTIVAYLWAGLSLWGQAKKLGATDA